MPHTQLTFILLILFSASRIEAQQGYSGNAVFDCNHQSAAAPPSPSYLYTCNGLRLSCRAFLIFRSQPNHSSVKTISGLFASDPSELARINNVSDHHTFTADKEVIVPVNCSCSGQYYQANASYVTGDNDTYYGIASDRYQGLSSCIALIGENPYNEADLSGGLAVSVPLRCACATGNQTMDGTEYLLTYSINENDTLSYLSQRFNVSEQRTASANGFAEQDPVVYPTTTVLIPLPREPISSQTIVHHPIEYAPSPLPPVLEPKRSRTKFLAGIGVAAVSLAVLSVLVAVFLCSHRRNTKRFKREKQGVLSKDIRNAVSSIDRELKVFEDEELKAATEDFSSRCRINGSVYRGAIGGTAVAIKKMTRDVTMEANILQKLNHVNLIGLCGVGTSGKDCYLVYEYMENGSLRDWLQDAGRCGGWTQRVQIALDIANGLHYLHNFTYPPHVHKDINSSNVLLNGKLRAKITNFSLARSSDWIEVGSTSTKNVEGTLGYMAPECLASGVVTPKLDVYAFGIVMSELITGLDVIQRRDGRGLLSEAIVSVVEGRNAEQELGELMRPDMRSTSPMGLVMRVAKLCVACLTRDPERRPGMDEVVAVLTMIQRDSQLWALAYQ